MDKLIYIIISFFVGVLIYYLMRSYCSCKVVEGQDARECDGMDRMMLCDSKTISDMCPCTCDTAACILLEDDNSPPNYQTDEYGQEYFLIDIGDDGLGARYNMRGQFSAGVTNNVHISDKNKIVTKVTEIISTLCTFPHLTPNEKKHYKTLLSFDSFNDNGIKGMIYIFHPDPLWVPQNLAVQSRGNRDNPGSGVNQYERLSDITYRIDQNTVVSDPFRSLGEKTSDGRSYDFETIGIDGGAGRCTSTRHLGNCGAMCSIADHNLLCNTTLLRSENILLHEFGHTLRESVLQYPAEDRSVDEWDHFKILEDFHNIWLNRVEFTDPENDPYFDVRKIYAYDVKEFWAELVQTWFHGERQPDTAGYPNQFIDTIDELNATIESSGEPIYTIHIMDTPTPLTLHDWLTKLLGPCRSDSTHPLCGSGEESESLKTCHQQNKDAFGGGH